MNYRSIAQLNNIIIKNLDKIPYDIDLVVGIPRSGIIPADLIALYRNIPYVSLNELEKGIIFSGGERLKSFDVNNIKNVLIVDDSLYSGNALAKCKKRIENVPYNFNYIFAAIFVVPENIHLIDIYFEILAPPRVFQWNIMHHPYLSQSCVDIDGVLCIDPTEKENDDGPLYEDFILNAKPFFIPTVKINTIVSCRLEKYRKQTEKWLSKYNITYDNLILLNLPNKEARIKWNKYGEYKADIYIKSNCELFIESSSNQAYKIAKISNKPVFCIENFEMLHFIEQDHSKQKIKEISKKIIRKLNFR